jgi:hypothetical protein
MEMIAGGLYTRREKREERKDEERSLHYGRDDTVKKEAKRGPSTAVGMTD